MTNKEILQADMLDILFEHRNKTYGAYALRKDYNNRLGIALGIALSAALLIFLISLLNKNNNNHDPSDNQNVVVISQVDLPKDKPIEPEIKEKPRPKPLVAQVDYQNIIVVKDDKADQILPETDDIIKSDIGNENIQGTTATDVVQKGTDTNEGNSILKEKEPEENYVYESSPASFPGGVESWLGFLRRYLQTPDDLEAGQRVEVRVKFWIDTDGSLSRFEIVQSGGSSFDKEVLRVMKKMPKWQPASQNRNKVAVSFTQPVIFMGVEE